MNNLVNGLKTAFIDYRIPSNLAYKPQFISNDYSEGKKVISSIEDELLSCDKFQISVAFITMGGITPLLQTLKELEEKGIPGEILTTNYLAFSDPDAIEKLHGLKNIKVKMYDVDSSESGFHTKGYIFKKAEIYRIIIGSSNMTSAALTINKEWNTKLVSTADGEMARQITHEFNELWNSPYSRDFDDFIEVYREKYKIIKRQRQIAKQEQTISLEKYKLQPNSMQVGFINSLKDIVALGEDRALLISATGTGKTYASAFAMRELGFKRVLFLVHRNQLAKQAKASFENVFDKSVSMGLVGGNRHEYDCDYVFATVETLNRDQHLTNYEPDAFDCIILDEAHHSSANTYKKVMDYFTPKLFLGMTATPDKRDDNIEERNIYEIFNYQIAYEIRLQQAMEENLLCPFHYFGISDIEVIGDEKEKKLSPEEFRQLVCGERVDRVLEQAEYYGFSGDRVKGLIFCSRIDESVELSNKFNQKTNPETGRNYRTIALNGDTSEAERAQAFECLAMNEEDAADGREPLDYIFSVEILNEGVDIVEVNQVIMLRPTQSPVVFIQQLGRGLRKARGKEYVVILDFIGNYEKNFMIPIALSGDRTYNKDNVRRYVGEGGRVIPGESTVHFDEVSRKRIFKAIDDANFSDLKLIKENYFNLKNKLGHIPALGDFDKYGEMDVCRIFDNSSLGSYYKFLVKHDKEYAVRLSKDEENVIEFISKKLANGKRIHELLLLKEMLKNEDRLLVNLAAELSEEYGITLNQLGTENIVNVMTNEFPAGASKNTYKDCIFIEREMIDISSYEKRLLKYVEAIWGTKLKEQCADYKTSDEFKRMLQNQDFRNIIEELVDFGISRYEKQYSRRYQDTDLVLYQKYTYEDVCRLLNWEHNEVPLNIGGYKYNARTKTFPVFINYDKAEGITATTNYKDHFLDESRLIAISKSKRNLESDDVQNFLKAGERGIDVQLFVRKNKDDNISKEFYYLGRMSATGKAEEFVMEGTSATAVEIEWALDQPVRDDIYKYIVNN